MSTPPPVASAPRELVVALEAPRSGWRRPRRQAEPRLVLSPRGILLEHAACVTPLRVPLGAVAAVAVERGAAKPGALEGRFPILRRLGQAVLPREEGIEGWLWTSLGGSALTMLGPEDEAPNLAVLMAQPLGEDVVAAHFDAEVVQRVAAASPLGAPSLYGLLLRVADATQAERAFSRLGLLKPVTDREVPPTLRRSLPTDRRADPTIVAVPAVGAGEASVAPPGLR
jgi:hypothetical protein